MAAALPIILFPDLANKLKSQYSKALKSDSITFIDTELEEREENYITAGHDLAVIHFECD